MLKQELKRIFKNKLLYIGFLIVILIIAIQFYDDVLADKDGNNYLADIDSNTMVHLTQYEKIQYQKSVCAPYIGRELDDDMVVDFLNIMNDVQLYQKQFIYEETPMLNIALSYMREMWPYSEERLMSLGDGYRTVDLDGGKYIIATVDKFMENNGLNEAIVIENGSGWYNLIKNLSTAYTIGLIVIAIVFIGVFSSDNRYNIRGIVLTTKYGRGKNAIMRVIASLLVTGAFFVLITVIDTVLYLSIYGISGAKAPLYMTELGQLLYQGIEMSVFGVFLQYIIGGFIVYFTVVAFVLLISSLLKSEFIGAIVSVSTLLFPWMVNELFTINHPIINSILNITPINIASVNPSNNGVLWYVGKDALSNMGGSDLSVLFCIPLLMGYAILCGCFVTIIVCSTCKKEDI